ncbi:MAG: aminoglycoside phosphotransferase family protein [Alphaproteobacteria bacterium]
MEIDQFLQKNNYADWAHDLLPCDASNRCYARLIKADKTVLFMDSSEEKSAFKNYLHVAEYLRKYHLSVPDIYAQDAAEGLAVIEDFGVESFTKILETNPEMEETLYAAAMDVLIHLHKQDTKSVDLPPYDVEKLLEETQILPDYFVPYQESILNQDAVQNYQEIWRDLLINITAQGENFFILRDYHIDNIIWLETRETDAKKCGLLDFQDAVLGSRVYDIVSLLQDARRDISEALEQKMLTEYFAAFPDLDPAAFMENYFIIGAQRHCKVLGIFARLHLRDGKPIYLKHLPRVENYLKRCIAREPKLSDLKNWMEVHCGY